MSLREIAINEVLDIDNMKFMAGQILYKEEADIEKGKAGKGQNIILNVALDILNRSALKLRKLNIAELENIGGDIKKSKHYPIWKKIIEVGDSINKPNNTVSEHLATFKTCLSFLEDRKNFRTKIKNEGSESIHFLIFSTLYLYQLEMSIILSTAYTNYFKSGQAIDTFINKRRGYKKIFKNVSELVEDKDFKKVINADLNDKSLIGECNYSNFDTVLNLYGEASIAATLKLLTLGLAKLLYKLAGGIRYVIYLFYVCKYSIDKKVDYLEKQLKMYETKDNDTRASLSKELEKEQVAYEVSLVDADRKTESDVEKDKINLKENDFTI